jgi:cellobiose transport system permease protein
MAFQRQNFGRAAAIAWILFLIIVMFGVLNFLISRRIASADTRITSRQAKRRLEQTKTARAESDTVKTHTAKTDTR